MAARPGQARLAAFRRAFEASADGSILVVRIFCLLMNSDAFFSFSDIPVRFEQVALGCPIRPLKNGVRTACGTDTVPLLHPCRATAPAHGAMQQRACVRRTLRSRV